MSGRKFWARGRDREWESETADGGPGRGAYRHGPLRRQAYARALLPNGLELLSCAHHNRQHSSAMTKIAMGIHDKAHRLMRPAA